MVVEHPAWVRARAEILAIAGSGPATLALLGDAGTGKTWLLRQLEADLRQRNRSVMLLRQGDLPWDLPDGGALLVDEACRMDARSRAELASQLRGLVILADLPAFERTLRFISPRPAVVSLTVLDAKQLRMFVNVWARQGDELPVTVTDDAVERLAAHSGGTPRLVAHLLGAALALRAEHRRIDADDIDEVATLRLGGIGEAEADPLPDVPLEPAAKAAPAPEVKPEQDAAPQSIPAQVELADMQVDWMDAAAGPQSARRAGRPWLAAAAASALAASLGVLWFLAGPQLTGWFQPAERSVPPMVAAVVPQSPSVANDRLASVEPGGQPAPAVTPVPPPATDAAPAKLAQAASAPAAVQPTAPDAPASIAANPPVQAVAEPAPATTPHPVRQVEPVAPDAAPEFTNEPATESAPSAPPTTTAQAVLPPAAPASQSPVAPAPTAAQQAEAVEPEAAPSSSQPEAALGSSESVHAPAVLETPAPETPAPETPAPATSTAAIPPAETAAPEATQDATAPSAPQPPVNVATQTPPETAPPTPPTEQEAATPPATGEPERLALAQPPVPAPPLPAPPLQAPTSVPYPARPSSPPAPTSQAMLDDRSLVPVVRVPPGGPGLVLVARRGDTLPRLYASIYRGLQPPPYEQVAAANPRPFRPGAIVVFPAPPGGWTRN